MQVSGTLKNFMWRCSSGLVFSLETVALAMIWIFWYYPRYC